MPRFFFNLYDDVTVIDEEGLELPTRAAAIDYAVRNARHIACTEVLEGHLNLTHRIEVVDERGEPVRTIEFGEVLRLEG